MKHAHQHTIEQFFSLLEQKDLTNWMTLWAEQAESRFPYANDVLNVTFEGKPAIKRFWINTCQLYARLSLSIKRILTEENLGVVFFESKHLIQNQDAFYQDLNIGLFEFDEKGKIKRYTEYFNPIKNQSHI